MIPQQKDKKNKSIYIYVLLFILIAPINNKNIYNEKLFSNKLIFKITGLSYEDNQNLTRDLIDINDNNIFKINFSVFTQKSNLITIILRLYLLMIFKY